MAARSSFSACSLSPSTAKALARSTLSSGEVVGFGVVWASMDCRMRRAWPWSPSLSQIRPAITAWGASLRSTVGLGSSISGETWSSTWRAGS